MGEALAAEPWREEFAFWGVAFLDSPRHWERKSLEGPRKESFPVRLKGQKVSLRMMMTVLSNQESTVAGQLWVERVKRRLHQRGRKMKTGMKMSQKTLLAAQVESKKTSTMGEEGLTCLMLVAQGKRIPMELGEKRMMMTVMVMKLVEQVFAAQKAVKRGWVEKPTTMMVHVAPFPRR